MATLSLFVQFQHFLAPMNHFHGYSVEQQLSSYCIYTDMLLGRPSEKNHPFFRLFPPLALNNDCLKLDEPAIIFISFNCNSTTNASTH